MTLTSKLFVLYATLVQGQTRGVALDVTEGKLQQSEPEQCTNTNTVRNT